MLSRLYVSGSAVRTAGLLSRNKRITELPISFKYARFLSTSKQISSPRKIPLLSPMASSSSIPAPDGITKIVVKNPVVELDGDEMTRIIWKKIREEVCFTFLKSSFYGLIVHVVAPCSSFFRILTSTSSITTCLLRTVTQCVESSFLCDRVLSPCDTRPMTRSRSTLRRPSKSTTSASSARRSLQTKRVSKVRATCTRF